MVGLFWLKPRLGRGAADQGSKPARWEGLAFTSAYVFALAVALSVLLSSKHETRSLLAWAVFIVFALCLTGIFLLYRRAKREVRREEAQRPRAEDGPSQFDE
jgi:hypothetical protein